MNQEKPFRHETLVPNLAVMSIENRRLGVIRTINACCVEFAGQDGSGLSSVRIDGLFDVQDGRVTLMCEAREVGRYTCPNHPSQSTHDTRPASSPILAAGSQPQTN